MRRLPLSPTRLAKTASAAAIAAAIVVATPAAMPASGAGSDSRQIKGIAGDAEKSVGVHAKIRVLSGDQLTATVARIRSAGIDYTREDFTWGTIEPRRGQFRWAATDAWVGAAAKQGLKIMAVIDAPPSWASAAWNIAPTSDFGMKAYADFVRAVVARYGSKGTFWAANPAIPKLPIEYFDIWNEPYSSEFWGTRFPDPASYARLFRLAVVTARPADPNAKFMLEANVTAFGTSNAPFLSAMFDAVPDLANFVDAVSAHPYASNGWGPRYCSAGSPDSRRYQVCRVEDIRSILNARGAGGAKLWITEIGWSTAPSAQGAVTETVQAQYIHDFFRVWNDRWPFVAGVIWYAYQTPETVPSSRNDYFGLVHPNGSAKPGWDALAQEARLRHTRCFILLCAAGEP